MSSEEIWVSEIVSTSLGEITVSIRLDTVIDPDEILDKLDKESDMLWEQAFKNIKKLESFNDKTPQYIVESVIKELTVIHNKQMHNAQEWQRWFHIGDIKLIKKFKNEKEKSKRRGA